MEFCPDQHEFRVHYSDVLEQADRTILFKLAFKHLCFEKGYVASFMAKLSQTQNSGCHFHISLHDIQTKLSLFLGNDYAVHPGISCSHLMRYFIGGIIKYTRDVFPFYAPFINSYKRFTNESFAPTSIAFWAYDNRTSPIRIVGKGQNLRIEVRYAGADINPYLSYSALLATGLRGIQDKIEPPEISTGNLYEKAKGLDPSKIIPKSLKEAVEIFSNS